MTEVYKSEYQTLTFDMELSRFEQTWLNTTSLDEEVLKEELLTFARMVEEYQPVIVISDKTNFKYDMKPEFKKWLMKNVPMEKIS